MLNLLTFVVLLAVAYLSFQSRKKPGIALALCWSMLALESVLQRGNSLLISRSWLVNVGVAAIVCFAAYASVRERRTQLPTIPKELYLYAVLLGVSAVSIAWSLSPHSATLMIKKTLPYIFVFAIVGPLCATDDKQLRYAVNTTIYFGVLVVVVAMLADQGRRGVLLTTVRGQQLESNPLANASYAGVVLICSLFSIYREKASGLVLAAKVAIAGLCVLAIVKTGSRGQLVAVVVACFIWFPITAKLALKRSTVMALVIACAAIIGSIFLIDDSQWSGRWSWNQISKARDGRLAASNIMLSKYFNADAAGLIGGLGNSTSFKYIQAYPHNVPVEVLTEEGPIGLILFLAIVWGAYRHGYYGMKQTHLLPQSVRVHFGLLLAIVTFQLILSFKQGSLWGSSSLFSVVISVGWIANGITFAIRQQEAYRQIYQDSTGQQSLLPAIKQSG
jgi:hypothetical protein